ncbi:MAG TPA: hypothetical protein VKD72_07415 [Gemmataceae bacterium]|nr:hypothetical protein [Gemmataceae bacterium]
MLRVVSFAAGETDEDLDVVAPMVVEGVLQVRRYPARGEFREVVELCGEGARGGPRGGRLHRGRRGTRSE